MCNTWEKAGAAADMADRWMNKSRVDLVNLILFFFSINHGVQNRFHAIFVSDLHFMKFDIGVSKLS